MKLIQGENTNSEEMFDYQEVLEMVGIKVLTPLEQAKQNMMMLKAKLTVVSAVRTFFELNPNEKNLYDTKSNKVIDRHDGEYSRFTQEALKKKVRDSESLYNELWKKENFKVIRSEEVV